MDLDFYHANSLLFSSRNTDFNNVHSQAFHHFKMLSIIPFDQSTAIIYTLPIKVIIADQSCYADIANMKFNFRFMFARKFEEFYHFQKFQIISGSSFKQASTERLLFKIRFK